MDHQHAIWAAKAGVDFVGLSFVRSPEEIRTLNSILRSCDSTARVVAKIEKREAILQVEGIVAEAEAVMAEYHMTLDYQFGTMIEIPRGALVSRPVPARQVLHLFERLRPGQVRGVPWFAPAILKLRER